FLATAFSFYLALHTLVGKAVSLKLCVSQYKYLSISDVLNITFFSLALAKLFKEHFLSLLLVIGLRLFWSLSGKC
ncbi:MAG: hypothetical protein AAFQ40_07395, partial [Cyanobacteria bacterium J06623_5]